MKNSGGNAALVFMVTLMVSGGAGFLLGAESGSPAPREKPAPDPADLAWMEELTPVIAGPHREIEPLAIQYRLSWNNVLNAGELAVVVRKEIDAGGGIDLVGTAEGRSSGLARALWAYDVKAESVVEAASLRPRLFKLTETERKKTFYFAMEFQPEKVLSETTRLATAEEAGETRHRVYRYENVRDVMSLALYLRSLEWRAGGAPVKLLVSPFNRPYHVEFKVTGREIKKIKGVKHDTIRLDLDLRKIETDHTLQEYEKMRQATMWFSEDEYRLPLEINADIFVGFISAQMTSRHWLPPEKAGSGAISPPAKKEGVIRKWFSGSGKAKNAE